jgi:quinol-cytochrome oxidoreductase complex cytochrome b subunit/coenzyme F420-reducing hydrogenase delta subunit
MSSPAAFDAAARPLRGVPARAVIAAERAFDRAFGAEANPLRQLGAVAFWMCLVSIGTGTWIYVFFDTSVAGAYASVDAMSRGGLSVNALARTVHRHSSDAFVAATLLHVAREWAYGRYAGFRWFSWVSGVPTLWLAIPAGVVGYLLVWDELAAWTALAITEWFAVLPGFDAGLPRNFIASEAVTDRLFSLLAFLHIGLPLLLLGAIWLHLQRLTRPRALPARALGWGMTAMLVALAAVHPALSLAPADLARVPQDVPIDWFFLFPFPLVQATSPQVAWAMAGIATALLAAAPWLTRAARPAPAVVDAAHCNGCQRCFADCPYGAIVMAPHPSGRGRIAVVAADQCAGCGICAGACPSASPFQAGERLATGIDLPALTVDALRLRIEAALRTRGAGDTIVAFGCAHGADVDVLADARTVAFALPCAGLLPPAFVDYALRAGGAGVLLASCGEGECAFRFGAEWTDARLAGAREPALRASAPRDRIERVAAADADGLVAARDRLAARLAGVAPMARRQPRRVAAESPP